MSQRKCLWGVALSAGQCEGAYLEDGKGLSLIDTLDMSKERCFKRFPLPSKDQFYPSHEASDFYHHMEEDLKLMKELGQSFRTSTGIKIFNAIFVIAATVHMRLLLQNGWHQGLWIECLTERLIVMQWSDDVKQNLRSIPFVSRRCLINERK